MPAWIWDNKDWLFSGIGAVLLTIAWTALRKPFTRKESSPSARNNALDFAPVTLASPEPEPLGIWRIVERIPLPGCQKWAWKHIYTPSRIAADVRLRISGGEQGMRFYRAEEASNVEISLYIINFTPLPITVDRIVGDIEVSNASVAPINYIRRAKVDQFSDATLYLQFTLSEQQIKRIHNLRKQGRTSGMNATVYLTTTFGEAEVRAYLKTGNTEFLNFDQLDSNA